MDRKVQSMLEEQERVRMEQEKQAAYERMDMAKQALASLGVDVGDAKHHQGVCVCLCVCMCHLKTLIHSLRWKAFQ